MPSSVHRRRNTPSARALALVLAAALGIAFAASPAQTGHQTLAAVERGRGEPTIVLIHGLGQDRGVWNRVAPRLEASHRLVLVDLPGHGQSAPLPEVSVREVARALERTLQERKVKRPVLVGHSYGGLVALEAAAARSNRVAGVVSIDLATYVEVDSERIAGLDQLIRQRYPLFLHGVFSSMTRDSGQVDSVVARAGLVEKDVLAEYFRDAWRTDMRPRIRTLKTPILVAATDATWPPAESWSSARKRLGYETEGPAIGRRIWGSAHLIPLDQPDSLATAIAEFAATLKAN